MSRNVGKCGRMPLEMVMCCVTRTVWGYSTVLPSLPERVTSSGSFCELECGLAYDVPAHYFHGHALAQLWDVLLCRTAVLFLAVVLCYHPWLRVRAAGTHLGFTL